MSTPSKGSRPTGRDEMSGLFRSVRHRSTAGEVQRAQGRRFATAVAVAILLTGAASGILYQQLYEGAGDDVTGLLPASAQAYINFQNPIQAVRATLPLDRWRDPDALARAVERRGLLSGTEGPPIGGIPRASIRQALTEVDQLTLAQVPTAAGSTWLGFLAFPQGWIEGDLRRALQDQTRPVDRQMGFAIDAYDGLAGSLPGSPTPPPVRLVTMEPHWVMSSGPVGGLEDLLEARVSGLTQPLRGRRGFNHRAATGAHAFWADIDLGALVDAFPAGARLRVEDWGRLRALLTEAITALSFQSDIIDGDERTLIRAQFTPDKTPLRGPLLTALTGGPSPLLTRLPAGPEAAIAVSLPATASIPSALRNGLNLLTKTIYGSTPTTGTEPWGDRIHWLLAPASGLRAQLASGLYPNGDWMVLLGVEDPDLAEETMAGFMQVLAPIMSNRVPAETAAAHGTIYGPTRTTHIVRDAQGTGVRWLWRMADGSVQVGSSEHALNRLDPDPGDAFTESVAGARALRAFEGEQALWAMAAPAWLSDRITRLDENTSWAALSARVAALLAPEFLIAFTLRARGDSLYISSNIGVWTILTAWLSASVRELDALWLANLAPPCREALALLCRGAPRSLPCQPLHPDRFRLAHGACAQVTRQNR